MKGNNDLIIENKKTRFTEKDLENFTIKSYLDDDLDEKEDNIRNKYNKRIKVLLAIFLFFNLIVESFNDWLLYCTPFFIINFILYVSMLCNIKQIRSLDKYIEVRIIEKLAIIQNKFYPIVGMDIKSEYQSVCYINREVYAKKCTGSIIKIDIR